jgi:hypothetical protein
MSDERTNEGRRRLLKALAVGGGAIAAAEALPEKWTKPVIDQVEVPLHAQASGPSFVLGFFTPTAGQVVWQGSATVDFVVTTTPAIPGLSITVAPGPESPAAISINAPATGTTTVDGVFIGSFRVLTPSIPALSPYTIVATAGSRSATVTVRVNAA